MNLTALSKLFAESRIPRRIDLQSQSQSSYTFSEQQRKTKRIRNIKRGQENNPFNVNSIGKNLFKKFKGWRFINFILKHTINNYTIF